MKLTRIRVKDFRSFVGEHEFEVASGINFFVGPNNCGKSNLIRSLELALDPDVAYVPAKDRPARPIMIGAPPTTRITLTFQVGDTAPEKTLLRRAAEYEHAVRQARTGSTSSKAQTYASDGELRMVTSFTANGVRQTTFQAKGMGAASVSGDNPIHERLERQFRSVVRFGVIHSGEDLGSLLQGKFREILQLVIEDHLKDELALAEAARTRYLESLQTDLLEPLRQKVLDRVQGMFPEITVANLVPDVPRVDHTLSSVDIQLGDSAVTELLDKGTGVRGAVLVSMLQYMAEQSRRSLVMAVEEPEAFLHPGGQEEIGRQLGSLATRADVSLLVTTHSPYVISRDASTLITELRKNGDGVTRNAGSAAGNEDRSELLGSLYRDAGLAGVLERALTIPGDARAVVITEGYTDGQFLKIACEAAGEAQLLDGLHVIPANGAKKVVFQAVLARSATELPVVAILDLDDAGRSARKGLEDFGWSATKEIIALAAWPGGCKKGHDVEIEDLIPTAVSERIVTRLGELEAVDGKTACGGSWHYAFSAAWKKTALEQLPTLMRAEDAAGLLWLAREINARVDKIEDARARAASFTRPSLTG